VREATPPGSVRPRRRLPLPGCVPAAVLPDTPTRYRAEPIDNCGAVPIDNPEPGRKLRAPIACHGVGPGQGWGAHQVSHGVGGAPSLARCQPNGYLLTTPKHLT
jgi:hypothetical protein